MTKLLLNPIRYISSHIIKTIVTKFGIPAVAINLINVLYHTSYSLISNVGIYPVYKVLKDIGNFFRENPTINALSAINSLRDYLAQNNSPYIVSTFIEQLRPILYKCFPISSGLLTLYQVFILGIFTTFIKPIIKYVFKFLLGLLLTAIGIIWNEYLSSLSYLRDFSLYILDFVESNTSFKFTKVDSGLTSKVISTVPTTEDTSPYIEVKNSGIYNDPITNNSQLPTTNDVNTNELNNTGSLLTIIGIVCLGVIGTIGLIVVADIYAHDTVNNIPVINTIADSINNLWNTHSVVSPKTEPDLSTTTPNTSPVVTVKTDLPKVETELSSPTVSEQPDLSSPKYIRNSYLDHELPEQISRSTSSDSYTSSNYNRYFKEGNITPPISRPSTPINQDE